MRRRWEHHAFRVCPLSDIADFDQVLAATQLGEGWAVAILFHELQPRLLRFLRAQEPAAADDLAGEVWEAMARGINGFSGDWGGFRGWVFTIARRRVTDHRRRRSRRRTDPVATFSEIASNDAPEQEALDALSGQAAAALVTAVLSGDQAEVVLLRVLGDLDSTQVATVMGRSENWVRVTQHRALRKLADRYGAKLGVMR